MTYDFDPLINRDITTDTDEEDAVPVEEDAPPDVVEDEITGEPE